MAPRSRGIAGNETARLIDGPGGLTKPDEPNHAFPACETLRPPKAANFPHPELGALEMLINLVNIYIG
jgi:hypothetical protein